MAVEPFSVYELVRDDPFAYWAVLVIGAFAAILFLLVGLSE